MAKKKTKIRATRKTSSQDLFKKHPNMKMLLAILTLSFLLLIYIKQLV